MARANRSGTSGRTRASGAGVSRRIAAGGWGFEEFNGDSRTERALTDETRAACFACHLKQKDQDYVFSKLTK
jgi:hypothetical protein